jgi:Peptidase inhibitor I78 family.
MRASLFLPVAVFSLSACATPSNAPTPPEEAAPSVRPVDEGYRCNPDALEGFVGQVATEEVVQKAVKAAGARHARIGKPGMAMTMDYREDRLTISVDAQNRIERISCG